MAIINDINLLQAKTLIPPYIQAIDAQLKKISSIILIMLIVACMVTGGTYFVLHQRHESLKAQKEMLLDEIAMRADKEILYRAVKSRIQVMEDVFEKQVNLHEVVGDVKSVAYPPVLRSFSVGEGTTVSIQLETSSILDAMEYASRVIALSEQGIIRNPILQSFALTEEGGLVLSISFQSTRS